MFTLIALARARTRLINSLSSSHSTDNTILHPMRFAINSVKLIMTISLIALISFICWLVYLVLDFTGKRKQPKSKSKSKSKSAVENHSPQLGQGEQGEQSEHCYKVHKRRSIKTTQQNNFKKEMEQIANLDVIDALELEIEALRKEQQDLISQANRTQCSNSKRIALKRKASTIQVRMMKLNEQVMKRRNKQ